MGDAQQGPFDLIELAAQLRYATIDAQTPVCREGETAWRALMDLPEYAAIQDIPIETIARHLEEKARPSSPARSPGFPVTAVMLSAAIIIAAILAIVLLWPSAKSPLKPVTNPFPHFEAWQRTDNAEFSVDCLAPLLRSASTGQVHSYRANVLGAGFGVDMQDVPGPTPDPELAISVIDSVKDEFLNGLSAQVISEKRLDTSDGLVRKRIIFAHSDTGRKMAGALLVVVGHGKMAAVWAVARSTQAGSDEIEHYVDSFELH